jgi:hypothetical protein
MPDLPESREVTHGIHDVVGRFPFGFVNDERAVKGRWLWLAWHFASYKLLVLSS